MYLGNVGMHDMRMMQSDQDTNNDSHTKTCVRSL